MNGRVIQGRFVTGRPVVAIGPGRPMPPVGPGRPTAAPAALGAGQPAAAAALRRATTTAAGPSATVQARATGDAVMVDPSVLGRTGPGQPLPPDLRGEMERALGADFAAVRIHVGRQAAAIGALAFTAGSDIFFAQGRYLPQTTEGRRLLGHELAHVVQQRQGRVRNPFGGGLAVVQSPQLEAEADRLGQRAASLRPASAAPAGPVRAGPAAPGTPQAATHPGAVQRAKVFNKPKEVKGSAAVAAKALAVRIYEDMQNQYKTWKRWHFGSLAHRGAWWGSAYPGDPEGAQNIPGNAVLALQELVKEKKASWVFSSSDSGGASFKRKTNKTNVIFIYHMKAPS